MGSEVPWKQWNWFALGLDGRIEEKQVRFHGSSRGRRWRTATGRKAKNEITLVQISFRATWTEC